MNINKQLVQVQNLNQLVTENYVGKERNENILQFNYTLPRQGILGRILKTEFLFWWELYS